MGFTFDPNKSARNVADRDLSFELVKELEWETALIDQDTRREYGETRLLALALLEGRLYATIISPRGQDVRVISFRKANRREIRRYAESQL